MSIAQRDALSRNITSLVGPINECSIARGGDPFIFPGNLKQQEALLKLSNTAIAGSTFTCSLPKSSAIKGVITGVLIIDSVEEIKAALVNQDVTDAYRVLKPDGNPSDRVFLTFVSRLPPSVKIAAVNFPVSRYIPNPYRCKKCWSLGHTQNNCGNDVAICKNCGRSHEESVSCITNCVNCSSPDHQADAASCPAFLEMKTVLRIAIQDSISIREARLKFGTRYAVR